MKTDESKVIRNIEALNLSKKSEILAQKLIEKIDMPVVFEINSQKIKIMEPDMGFIIISSG